NRWFSGQAPGNINLNNVAAALGYGPLQGGNLPNGAKRYYRVALCTGDDGWECKNALIRLSPNGLEVVDPGSLDNWDEVNEEMTAEMKRKAENDSNGVWIVKSIEDGVKDTEINVYPNP